MGLSSALTAGVSGIQRHQLKLDVIGNDIANVNTYGYKEQRVIFQDVLYNTLKSGTAPAGTNAGTNPSQIGGGVDLAAIQTNFNDGDIETTGIMSDMAIEGNGFFVLKDGISEVYTRDGAFTLNQERKLVNGASGMKVQGWVQTRDNAGNSTVNTGGAIEDIVIPVGDNRIAKATSKVVMNGNLNNAGDVGTTGTILNSQKLFSSTGDVEVSDGSHDLRDVYIKDPAGGVNNVRLFKGTGATGTDTNTLTSGDQVTVQMMKGGRPLEAIFVYGNGDLVENTSGDLKPDGFNDAGLESYDGTTLNDFLTWFDTAFGLKAVEDKGSASATNAAHGVDGDNPNDLVDMGNGSANPFIDETDGSGFELVLTNRGAENFVADATGTRDTTNNTGPKVAIHNSTRQFNIVAGANDDVKVGSSYVDLDGSGSFNKEKDIVLEDVVSYVVTGNSTVTKGADSFGSAAQLSVLSLATNTAQATLTAGTDSLDMFIDTDSDGIYDAKLDQIVKNAWDNDVLGGAATAALTAGTTNLQLTFDVSTGASAINQTMSTTSITKGMSIFDTANRYTVTGVSLDSTTNVLTVDFDIPNVAVVAGDVTFQGASFVTAGQYTATTASSAGSTIVTALNAPKANLSSTKKVYEGKPIYKTMVDNEKGMAGTMFTDGDIKAVVETEAVLSIAVATGSLTDVEGFATATITGKGSSLKTGMSIIDSVNGNKYIVDKIVGDVVTFDRAKVGATDAFAATSVFNGFAYLDSDADGTNDETVFRVRNDMDDLTASTSGTLFIDLDNNGVKATTDLEVETTSSKRTLASFSDNEVVYKDKNTGNVYRKVPAMYDPENRLVYLDKNNKGTYDEIRYNLVNSGVDTTATEARWVIDEGFNGVASGGDTTLLANKAIGSAVSESATIDMATSSSINGIKTGAARIQLRGNIGTVNEISGLSMISGADKVERNIFAASTLADTSSAGFSQEAAANGESVNQNIVVYDSLGKSHDVSVTFVLEDKTNDKASWRWYAETADATQATGAFPVNDPRGVSPSINVGTGLVEFDNFGRFLRSDPTTPLISIPLEGMDTDSALNISPDFSILTSFAESTGSQVDVREQDGFAQGVMERYSVAADGAVTGIYSNGMREIVAKVALAAFANPDGLIRNGANTFSVGSNSGNAMVGEAGTGERGTVKGEALELSNVDITKEFTEMITTQRAYQANARVITKSDELLQELMQIIR